MNSFWKELGASVIMGIVIPAMVLAMATHATRKKPLDHEILETHEPEATILSEGTAAEPYKTKITVLTKDGPQEQELEDYLVRVVLGEMPATFEEEALKAQAVVARTYTLKAFQGKHKHTDADICTDSACCQAYITEKEYLDKGGSPDNVKKIEAAVDATAGLVLTYEGKLIEATYFSCSGGSTEDAVAVWGTDVPYLKATPSPGEEGATHYEDSVTYTASEFQKALNVSLTGAPRDWFGAVTYTPGGGVKTMDIGGKSYKGTTLRSQLGLRSTIFSVSTGNDVITITTRGFGHRVGMSQYGAEAMAAEGSTFEEILNHYYQGTILQPFC